MPVVEELIRVESGGELSFGNHLAKSKQKLPAFEVKGDVYSIKSSAEMTKLEKNENLLFESVPGATVLSFVMTEKEISFTLYGADDTQIILELEPSAEYDIFVNGAGLGKVKTTMSGKLVFSAELSDEPVEVKVRKA